MYLKKENLLYEVEIPQYPLRVQTSAARSAKYYSKLKGRGRETKLPKWVQKYTKFDSLGYLLDSEGNRIVSNNRSAGTPKYVPINGQIFYSQKGGEFTRAKVVKYLHEYFTPIVSEIPQFEKFPIILTLNWQIPYNYHTMDNTNMSFAFVKVFEDVLVNEGKIPDDEVAFISGSFPFYTPVPTLDERKLIFSFYHDDRAEVQQLKLL